MYMYHHLIDSELKETPLKLYVSSLRVVRTSIIVTIKSKRYSDIKLLVLGESVNDILKQLYFKTQVLIKS